MKVIAMLFLIAMAVSGCDLVPVGQQELQQAAQRALEESVRASFPGSSHSFWTVSELRVEEHGKTVVADGTGKRTVVPVGIKAKAFACGFTGGASPNVTYAALDKDLSIDVYRNWLGLIEYRITGDRSRFVKTNNFSCRGSAVTGIVDSIDVRMCSLRLDTSHGLFSASIPDPAIAGLLAKKFKPGLAVSLYLDRSGPAPPALQRAVYLERH